jgi:di- and tripeptidase
MEILKDVSQACGRPVEELMKVWREPSFSIANISATGAVNKTVIPKKVSADISIRIVPDQVRRLLPWRGRAQLTRQDLKAITDSLVKYCQDEFTSLGSRNKFEVSPYGSNRLKGGSLTSRSTSLTRRLGG